MPFVKWAIDNQAEITGAVVAVLVFAHASLGALEILARALKGAAKVLTPKDKRDDDAAEAVEHWAARAAAKVSSLKAWVPRVSMGPRPPKDGAR